MADSIRWCKRCDRPIYSYTREPHACPPTWLVWVPEDGEDESDAHGVFGDDPEDAAERHVKGFDCESTQQLLGEGFLVHVRDRFGAPGRPTKTKRIRRVPLFGLAASALASWLAATRGRPNPLGLAFPGAQGCHRSRTHVIRWSLWQEALVKAKLGRRFRWHDLRHTCASSLVSGTWGRSWSLEEVREVLGHTTIAVTQRYAHLSASAVQRAAAATPWKPTVAATPAATGGSKGGKGSSPKRARLLGSRFRELNSRPTVYETMALAHDFAPLPTPGPIRGRSLAILEAAARGEDVGPAIADLRAELVTTMGRSLDRLSGPHALVEVARLAGVDDAGDDA